MLQKPYKSLGLLLLLSLMGLIAACENPVEFEGGLGEIELAEITDMDGNLIADSHQEHEHWHFAGTRESLHLHAGEAVEVRNFFVTKA